MLDHCPDVDKCCGVGLRQAVMLIAVVGMVLGVVYLVAYSYRGARTLYHLGAPRAVKRLSLRYAHGVLGVLVFAAHALVLGAACYRNATLCELYVWAMLVVVTGAVCVNLVVVVMAYRANLDTYGCMLLCATACGLALALYFIVVVVNYSRTLPGLTGSPSGHVNVSPH